MIMNSTVEPRISGPCSYGHLTQLGSISCMYFYCLQYESIAVPCGVSACVKSGKTAGRKHPLVTA